MSTFNKVNRILARLVFVAAGIFAIGTTAVAAMTGQTMLLLFTMLGLAAAGYAGQVISRTSRSRHAAVTQIEPDLVHTAA